MLKSSAEILGIALFNGGGGNSLSSSIKNFIQDSLIPMVKPNRSMDRTNGRTSRNDQDVMGYNYNICG